MRNYIFFGDKSLHPFLVTPARFGEFLMLSIPVITIMLLAGCALLEEQPVSTTRAVLHPTTRSSELKTINSSASYNLLFQASGWIEPDPYPIRIPALYDGVVKDIYVLEGELVKPGQKLVSMIDDDARISLRSAIAAFEEAKSRELEIVSELSVLKLTRKKADYEQQQAKAVLDEHNDYLNRLESLPAGSVSLYDINRSRYQTDSTRLSFEVMSANVNIARARINLLTQKLNSQKQITAMKAIMVEKAELDLNRTEIISSAKGRVLKLFASPGKRLMQQMDMPEASTAITLYNEERLQARIDVPIADVSKLLEGQKVEITCSMLPNVKFEGRLSRISGEADLQKNTLQVKVQILEPDNRLRPEMLCRAKFFSEPQMESKSQNLDGMGVFIPLSLRPDNNQSVTKMWVIGMDGKSAEIRTVMFGDEIINKYICVLSGLKAGDQIILNPPKSLQSGDLVKVLQNQ